jgi:hypothetical protein
VNRNRIILILWLGLAPAAGLSCSGESPLATQTEGDTPAGGGTVLPVDSSSSVPPVVDTVSVPPGDTVSVPPVDTVSVPPVDSGGVPLVTNFLICQQQEYATNTAVIGPAGGQITVGDHTLNISAGALLQDVTITAEQVEGTVNSVRFSPEGLLFVVPAELTLSYANCRNVAESKRIVYTDELLNILEPTLSQDFSDSLQVRALILHFSRYAIAY